MTKEKSNSGEVSVSGGRNPPRGGSAIGIPEQAYDVLSEVEKTLAEISNKEEVIEGKARRITSVSACSRKAKAALLKLQSIASLFELEEPTKD